MAAGRARPAPIVERLLTPNVRAAWRASAARRTPDEWERALPPTRRHASARARDPDFPAALRYDPQPPAVLFVRGDLDVLDGRRVGIVGTRNATQAGRDIAHALGRDLAEAGVAVVSGLAKGIDGAAHRGALARRRRARPSPSSATGPTARTRASNTGLWHDVCDRGPAAVRVAAGHGARAVPLPAAQPHHRRPLRGARRGREPRAGRVARSPPKPPSTASVEVMAVPGSVRNRAASGTNQLLRDGAAPVTDVDDVLVALGLDTAATGAAPYDPRPLPRGLEADVLDRCRRDPCTLDDVVSALGLPIAEAAMALARLERTGLGPRSRRLVRGRGVRGREPSVRPNTLACSACRAAGERGRLPTTCRRPGPSTRSPRSLTSLSDHTVAAYAADVRGFAAWAARGGVDAPAAVRRTTVRRYLAYLTTRQYARRSIARKVAALRRYFRWRGPHRASLTADPDGRAAGHRRRRPPASRARPARPRRSCSTAPTPDDEPDWRRRRDDAVLEVLYGSGLRVSELCGLDVVVARPRPGGGHRLGQGRKQRRVPLSAPAVAALRAWLAVRRDVVADGRRGRRPVRQRAGPPAHAARRASHRRSPVADADAPARAPPQLRHPPARRRGRPARRAGAARPRRRGDDAALHARQPRAAARGLRSRAPPRMST